MIRPTIIATGSSGNAVLLGESILIDCGVRWKHLAPAVQGLRLVLMTHQHGDHFCKSAVKKLAEERPLVRWACGEWMVPLLSSCGVAADRIDLMADKQGMDYPGLCTVKRQNTMHDVPNCCWHLDIAGQRIFYATDCGNLEGIEAKGYELYLIEANHTQQELREREALKKSRGEYSYEARAALNHLSAEKANEWLMDNAAEYSRIIYLHQHRD